MSIFQKVNRIMSLRNGIRNRLVQFGVVQGGAKLADCKDALDEMTDNTKKTTTSTAMTGTFSSGTTGRIFANPHEGYCSNDSLVSVPVVNLAAMNIKQGVNVGGVVGTCTYEHNGILTFDIRSSGSESSSKVKIWDKHGLVYTAPRGGDAQGTCSFVGNMVAVYAINSDAGSGTGATFIAAPVQYMGLFRMESANPSIEFY